MSSPGIASTISRINASFSQCLCRLLVINQYRLGKSGATKDNVDSKTADG